MLGTTELVEGSGGSGVGGGDTHEVMDGIGDDDRGIGGGGGGGSGGNRWPRQETLALLKIRSDMDVVFRDSSLKGPLWEQVSRKLADLGYHRNSKKCKEKFENVYKYHKRTKEGRVGKSDGKTYRFFDQLQALDHHQSSSSFPPPQLHDEEAVPVSMVMPHRHGTAVTVPLSSPHSITTVVHAPQRVNPINQIPPPQSQPQLQLHPQPQTQAQAQPVHIQQQVMPVQSSPIQMEASMPSSPSATQSSSSSTSSDEEIMMGRRKRKRKWKDFFERLMREVIDKQEELQKRFLEAVEKREHDRLSREEAWKNQEIARLNREHEILVQERSMAAAKDSALISFLQKLSEQQQIPLPLPEQIQTQTQTQTQTQNQIPRVTTPIVTTIITNQSEAQPQPQPQLQPQPQIQVPVSLPQPQPQTQLPPAPQQAMVVVVNQQKANNGDHDDLNQLTPMTGASSSRWPKAEVEALIKLRTTLDQKYQDNGPKGPLWEEISSSMKKIGYNRNAKRCKEKWENINKYFKKVKESNKKRPEDSKTCPYFSQLDAIYREKNKSETTTIITTATPSPTTNISLYQQTATNASSIGQISAQPEPQWQVQHGSDSDEEEDEEDDDDDDNNGNGRFEIVANNAAAGSVSNATNTSATVV